MPVWESKITLQQCWPAGGSSIWPAAEIGVGSIATNLRSAGAPERRRHPLLTSRGDVRYRKLSSRRFESLSTSGQPVRANVPNMFFAVFEEAHTQYLVEDTMPEEDWRAWRATIDRMGRRPLRAPGVAARWLDVQRFLPALHGRVFPAAAAGVIRQHVRDSRDVSPSADPSRHLLKWAAPGDVYGCDCRRQASVDGKMHEHFDTMAARLSTRRPGHGRRRSTPQPRRHG